ncbi:Hypothetical protein NTJ_01816 [Nesidiocoris tenuis]|uniref:BTB domain-containing protein n=1 Tax=Nesidiocoris tenuis TaxID=355587 RepID=A0ABN7ACW9_9HEMI|nr:Hypothetical protein NTJ_01816 [Nesidiocoris tenuis]
MKSRRASTSNGFARKFQEPVIPTQTFDTPQFVLEKYYDFMKQGLFSDFQIVVQGNVFQVHKLVLASRSSYFVTLFETGMQETRENKLSLTDIELDVFEIFLKYIYTCQIEKQDLENHAESLIFAGAKYQMPQLVAQCESILIGHTRPENAANHLLIAYLLDCSKLKSAALGLALEHFDGVSTSKCWSDICLHHNLVTEVETTWMTSYTKITDDFGEIKSIGTYDVHWWLSQISITAGETGIKQSSSFTIPDLGQWKLRIAGGGSLYLVHVGTPQPAPPLRCYFTILTSTSSYDFREKFESQGIWSSDTHYSRVIILKEGALPVGIYRNLAKWKIHIRIDPGTSSGTADTITDAYSEYWKTGEYTDAEIAVQNQTFSVHKLVVSAGSPVFKEYFSEKKSVTIEGIEPTAMEKLLKLMYQCDDIFETAGLDTLYAATRFEVHQRITMRLRAAICRRISGENAVDVLKFSHQNKDEMLKMSALEFILLHFHTDSIQLAWSGLEEEPELHLEILRYMHKSTIFC